MMPKCHFKSCDLPALSSLCARVDIKSAVPSSGLNHRNKSLLVAWKKNGEASFHPECWKVLLAAARKPLSRGTKKRKQHPSAQSSNQLDMIDSEKIMIRHANKTIERFDANSDIAEKAETVADMILKSTHCVFFTGAGISTSAGLGDFRGKGGKWTEQDREAVNIDAVFEENEDHTDDKHADKAENDDSDDEEENIAYEHLRPTLTHEAIAKLTEMGHVKYLVSQNCDGLHTLSGIPPEKISELHGNVFVEKCEKCERRYERPFYVCDDVSDIYLQEISDFGKTNVIRPKFMVRCDLCGLCHRTGRRCEEKKCGGYLMDTIINFRDNLERDILDRAFDEAFSCDLIICLGTTLTVTPASDIVDAIKEPRRVVICNRQATEKDDNCRRIDKQGQPLGVRIHGDCDRFMRHLMLKLLSAQDFKMFEEGLPRRAVAYDKKRIN